MRRARVLVGGDLAGRVQHEEPGGLAVTRLDADRTAEVLDDLVEDLAEAVLAGGIDRGRPDQVRDTVDEHLPVPSGRAMAITIGDVMTSLGVPVMGSFIKAGRALRVSMAG